ncbi:MAG: peptide-methionine (S)-S-oxide reductase MsrA [Aeromonadales bacterium]|nr:peptide-methionine (S)-S-oxide reductase MsrA [Aeromonadales bacterium]MDY2892130.1 peptide-methionine (S)-S-oxide reductase MsrA [Succinivibrio sp.]
MADQNGLRTAYLAGGCFWGVSEFFSRIPGVASTVTGYANSRIDNPSYKQVKAQEADAAETVEVKYDPQVITLEELLHAFFLIIDPFSVNRQGLDSGRSYRTGAYYTNNEDKAVISKAFHEAEQRLGRKIAVECLPLANFYRAEEYHQDYLKKNPGGYCHVDFGKLKIFRDELLKEGRHFEDWQI